MEEKRLHAKFKQHWIQGELFDGDVIRAWLETDEVKCQTLHQNPFDGTYPQGKD